MEIPTTDGDATTSVGELQSDFKIKLTSLTCCAKDMLLLLYRGCWGDVDFRDGYMEHSLGLFALLLGTLEWKARTSNGRGSAADN